MLVYKISNFAYLDRYKYIPQNLIVVVAGFLLRLSNGLKYDFFSFLKKLFEFDIFN